MAHSPIRILFGAYQTRHLSNGGMESATRIFEGLRDRFDWSLLTTREMPRTQRWREGGAKVAITPFDEEGSKWARRFAGLRWNAAFVRAEKSLRPDLVHLNDIQSYQAYAFAHLPGGKPPLVFTLRDTTPPGQPYSPIWSKLARDVERIVVLSEEMGAELTRKLPAAAGKIEVINSIVDLQNFAPPSDEERVSARRRLGIGEHEFAIGCIGAIREKKGQLAFVQDALHFILSDHPDAKLHFIGDAGDTTDPYWTEFEQAIAAPAVRHAVEVHGHQDDMALWFKALDLVLIAANHEGLARAMIEGMASGVAVVSTDVCSAREMLEPTGAGIVVEREDWPAMREAVSKMRDDGFRAECGRKGREAAERLFDESIVVDRFAKLYEKIGGRHAAKEDRRTQR